MGNFHRALVGCALLLCGTSVVDAAPPAKSPVHQPAPAKPCSHSTSHPPAHRPTTSPSPPHSCCILDDIIALLNGPLRNEASSFCSGYLHYTPPPTVHRTVAVTSTEQVTITLPDATQTATIILTDIESITSTVDDTLADPTVTVQETVTAATPTVFVKRNLPGLGGYLPSRISSACSCIVTRNTIPATQVTTITQTALNTDTIGPIMTIVVTQTIVVSETSVVDVTVTLPPTSTITDIVSTTVTPAPVTVTTSAPTPSCDIEAGEPAFQVTLPFDAGTQTLSGCKSVCDENFGCAAFAYDPSNSLCTLLNTDANDAANASPGTGYFYYNRDCSV